MGMKYTIKQIQNTYYVLDNNTPVATPMGNPYNTNHLELAELLLSDVEEYGPDPRNQQAKSYVMFHAGYCDFGRQVPKRTLVDNIFLGYNPDWDIALMASRWFEDIMNDPFASDPGIEIEPEFFFGPHVEPEEIYAWLKTLSRRALITVQTIGGNLHSILVGYRTVTNDQYCVTEHLAKGILKYGNTVDVPEDLENDPDAIIRIYTDFLDRAQVYAQFPDD